jgi:tetratricopeptide (TPR) repeat protein
MIHLALAIVLGLAGAPGQGPDKGWAAGGLPVGPTDNVADTEIAPAPTARPRAASPGVVFAQAVPCAARDAYHRALEKLRAGRPADAAVLLRDAVARFPDYFDANLALGIAEGSAGRFVEAETALAAATRVNPRHAKAHYFRAVALVALADADPARQSARLADASSELDRAWDLGGGTLAVVYLQRARIHERLGDRAAAAAALERYLRLEPNAANAAALRDAAARLRAR